ncbi:MAG: macro domain-containing protein [Chloroflexota bacterium]
MQTFVNNVSLELVIGDITDLAVDAIVNAANSYLVLGAGVAGAIDEKGGPSIQAECEAIGHCDVGSAVITSGGQLLAKYVIHAVGPYQGEGDEDAKLAGATLASLQLAQQYGLKSIAFPAISTGIFRYPLDDCARIMLRMAIDFAVEKPTPIKRIVFCLFDKQAYRIFSETLAKQIGNLGVSPTSE